MKAISDPVKNGSRTNQPPRLIYKITTFVIKIINNNRGLPIVIKSAFLICFINGAS